MSGLISLVSIGTIAGRTSETSGSMSSKDRGNDFINQMLSSGDRVEALEWLTSATPGVHRNIAEMPNRDSILFVRKLYKLGAKEVVALRTGANGNYESTDTLIATLPRDPAGRKAIFEFERRRVEEMGLEPYEDVGQRHLFVWFDGGGSLAFQARTKAGAKRSRGKKATGPTVHDFRPKTPEFRGIADEMMPKERPRSREKARGINASAKLTEMWLRPAIYGDEVINELAKQWGMSRKKLIEMRELMIRTMSLQSPGSQERTDSRKRPMAPGKSRAIVQSLANQLKASNPIKSTKRSKKTPKRGRVR